jgi:sugar lactone lactonase YvrE
MATLIGAATCTMMLSGASAAAAAPFRSSQALPQGHAAAAGSISTIAGGVGGPALATNVALNDPCGVSYTGGRLYAGDSSSVRQVNPGSGALTTPAGNGTFGPVGTGGPAAAATLNGACGAASVSAGDLVIADTFVERIQVVAAHTGTSYGQAMTRGHIYTVAGIGTQGYSGDGGPATGAKLNRPQDVIVDGAGNLVIADTSNFRIRVVAERTGEFYGQAMTAGDIYTIAGTGRAGFSGDGGPAASAQLSEPHWLTMDGAGNLVIADSGNERLRVVAGHTGTFYGQAMTAGDIYTVAGDGSFRFSGDGGPALRAGMNPTGVAVDGAGNLVIADDENERVRVVADSTGTFYGQAMTAGDVYTVAGDGIQGFSGDGGAATGAEVHFPVGVAVDNAGNLVIADENNLRLRVVAAHTGTFYGISMTIGDIYTAAGNGQTTVFSGDGGPATSAQLDSPGGLTLDHAGNAVIADTNNNRIRVLAAHTGTFYGQAMTAGDIYTVAGKSRGGFSGDGGPATSAQLSNPEEASVDGAGNLVIADSGNERIRVVAERTGTFYGRAMTAGDIYSVAGNGTEGFSGDGGPATSAEFSIPHDVSADGAGNLVIADSFNYRIRVVAERTGRFYGQAMTAGDIYTVAGTGQGGFSGDGGPAVAATVNDPCWVTIDSTGNLVIADTFNFRIRVVAERTGTFYGQAMTAGDIYTVAGTGQQGFSGDGGPAIDAQVKQVCSVMPDAAGNLVIADTFNNRIRVLAERSGTFYGHAMTVGDIYTVAGNGHSGFYGDGGPAAAAGLSQPVGAVGDSAGNLVLTDTGHGRVRQVAG